MTAASWRANPENSSATNHRLWSELVALLRLLGEALGEEVLTDLSGGRVNTKDLRVIAYIEQIEQTLFETRGTSLAVETSSKPHLRSTGS